LESYQGNTEGIVAIVLGFLISARLNSTYQS